MDDLALREILKEKGVKLTVQRLAVLKVLTENPGKHMTTEEIYDQIRIQNPEIGLATVYRTIQLFLELRLIDKINIDDKFIRYEIAQKKQSGAHRHHHLICVECGAIYSFAEDWLEAFEAQIKETMGFEVQDHEVKLYGRCKNCIAADDKKEIGKEKQSV